MVAKQVSADGSGERVEGDVAALRRLLAGRYSCRAYRPDPVPHAIICQMLELAQRTASWCNSQPWQTIVTEGPGTEQVREILYRHAATGAASDGLPAAPDIAFPEAYRGIYKERQREVGWQLYESVGIAKGDRVGSGQQALENFRLFGAPHMLLITSERDLGTYGAVDCGLYVGNLLLAAQSLGLGMVPQAAIASCAPLLRDMFEIPPNRIIILGASFGYPDEAHPANSFRTTRATIDSSVTFVSE